MLVGTDGSIELGFGKDLHKFVNKDSIMEEVRNALIRRKDSADDVFKVMIFFNNKPGGNIGYNLRIVEKSLFPEFTNNQNFTISDFLIVRNGSSDLTIEDLIDLQSILIKENSVCDGSETPFHEEELNEDDEELENENQQLDRFTSSNNSEFKIRLLLNTGIPLFVRLFKNKLFGLPFTLVKELNKETCYHREIFLSLRNVRLSETGLSRVTKYEPSEIVLTQVDSMSLEVDDDDLNDEYQLFSLGMGMDVLDEESDSPIYEQIVKHF